MITPDSDIFFLKRLRVATREIHQSLEELTQVEKLLNIAPNRTVYKTLLATHYMYHMEVARHLKIANVGVLDWPQCDRIPALYQDLDQLDIELPYEVLPQLHFESPAHALGLCYVAEGSCIGNQQLLKQMKNYPIFMDWNAHAFFKSCTHNFSERWKTFLELLTPYGVNYYEDVESGALAGFNHFKQLLLATYATPQ